MKSASSCAAYLLATGKRDAWSDAPAGFSVFLSFEYASLVFDDDLRHEKYDRKHSDDEGRYDVIGMVENIIFVVCTREGRIFPWIFETW